MNKYRLAFKDNNIENEYRKKFNNKIFHIYTFTRLCFIIYGFRAFYVDYKSKIFEGYILGMEGYFVLG